MRERGRRYEGSGGQDDGGMERLGEQSGEGKKESVKENLYRQLRQSP